MRKPIQFIRGETKLEFGLTYLPAKPFLEMSEDKIESNTWSASRHADGSALEHWSAAHGGPVVRLEISEADFVALREQRVSMEDIVTHYGMFIDSWTNSTWGKNK